MKHIDNEDEDDGDNGDDDEDDDADHCLHLNIVMFEDNQNHMRVLLACFWWSPFQVLLFSGPVYRF